MSVIEIYGQDGILRGEVVANAAREWALNGYGGRMAYCQAAFQVSVIDPRVDVGWFEYGNLVLIRHDKLPWWGGVIEPPRRWDTGVMNVTAYGAEYLLARRRAGGNEPFDGTPGDYFIKALRLANDAGDTRIMAGEIERVGKPLARKYDFSNIAEGINQVAAEFHQDWDVTPDINNNGRVYFRGNWYVKKGAALDFTLEDGWNLESVNNYEEQGEIINNLEGVSDASSSNARLRYIANDDESIGLYGLHQGRQNFDVKTLESLKAETEAKLNTTAYPRRVFDVSAADVGDTWKNIRTGNILSIRLPSSGLVGGKLGVEAKVRIVGMKYDEDRGVVDLTCDEER